MKHGKYLYPVIIAMMLTLTTSCQKTETGGKPSIVVTYSILGSIVQELTGENSDVIVSIPNGLDPHEWEPSAKAIEAINKADLVIRNGLGLEEGMEQSLDAAEKAGVRIFTASDHIAIRHVGQGEGIPSGDPDQAVGASDPHLWTDPVTIKAVIEALVPVLKNELGIDIADRAGTLEGRLNDLDRQIRDTMSAIPAEDRKLVTGHESMGYFAQRYDLILTGVIIPSLSSQAEVSASDLAGLKKTIQDNRVKAVFTEIGTSTAIARTIGEETGIKVVELNTHTLPPDGSYFTYINDLAGTIASALK